LTSTKTSRPDSSATKVPANKAFDKLYWLRIALGGLGGIAADLLFHTDYLDGISVGLGCFLISYYFARFAWYKNIDKGSAGKIFSTGLGGFVLLFLFAWILFFTISSG
jgi:hypothetical protein